MDKNERVWIVDFNPYGEPTETLLFTWAELDMLASETELEEPLEEHSVAEFRIVESAAEVLQSAVGASRGPVDTPHFGDAGGFEEFMRQCVNDRKKADSDDEDARK